MTHEEVNRVLESCVEELASREHARWSHWQSYLHSKGTKQADGSLLLPSELVQRWEEQARTDYEDLSHEEQESDREQVRKYLPFLVSKLTDRA